MTKVKIELEYPFEEVPRNAELLTVADGVYWLRMSLPMALDHINLYLLEEKEGWWIVDTGLKQDSTRAAWRQLFDGPMAGKPVLGVIVTHMHPDHIGQAGWLCEHWQVPLYISFGEYYVGRTFTSLSVENLGWTTRRHFRRLGLDERIFEEMRTTFRGMGAYAEPLPGAFQRLAEGDRLHIGSRAWEVMVGRGHSPEHVCLFDPRDRILLSGDQIIPRITSNISVTPMEPDGNPLRDWFNSLERFLHELPADTLVLPAHNTPFRGVQARLRYLIDHHRDHLEALEEACLTPQCALELLPVMFDRKLDGSQVNMALGEALAHLNYLYYTGRVERYLDEQGIYRYRTLDPSVRERVGKVVHERATEPMEV